MNTTDFTIDYATLKLLATAERELADFKRGMNDNRHAAGAPPIYP